VEAKAIVVGSSAVGGVCAKALANHGVETLVLEENFKPGKFHKCSGIMSKAGLESLGVSIKECTLNEVRGARVFAGGTELKFEASSTKGVVIDRQAYDERCAQEAQEAGAKLVLNARVEKVSSHDGGFTVSTPSDSFSSKVLVGCDGANSTVARTLGFPPIEARDFVLAWEGEFSGCRVSDPRLVHIYLEPSICKGFFGWLIPVSEDRARIGFASADFPKVREAKQAFLNLAPVQEVLGPTGSASCECVREFNYVIPIKPRAATQAGNAMLCGDSAGQVKATTGGGVVFGGKCAFIAADEIANHFSSGTPINYERRWREKYGGVLKAHNFIRAAYNFAEGFDNGSVLKASLAVGNAIGLPGFLSAKGDMDFIVS
jgi:geranylgeranyl reductase family protein